MKKDIGRKILKMGILLFLGGMIGGMVVVLSKANFAINKATSVEQKADSLKAETAHTKDSVIIATVEQAISKINLDSVILKTGKRYIYLDYKTSSDFAYAIDVNGDVIGKVMSIIPIDTLKSRYKGYTKTEFYKQEIRKDSIKRK